MNLADGQTTGREDAHAAQRADTGEIGNVEADIAANGAKRTDTTAAGMRCGTSEAAGPAVANVGPRPIALDTVNDTTLLPVVADGAANETTGNPVMAVGGRSLSSHPRPPTSEERTTRRSTSST